MPDGSVPLLIAIIALVILSGFFSGTETAFSCANRIKLRTLATAGNKKAEKILVLAEEKFDKLISTILVGNNIVNITTATLGTMLFAKLLINSSVDSSLVSTAVITVAVLIFGEITPKFVAKTFPERFAMLFYPIVMFFYYILTPINIIFSGYKWILSKIFKLKADDVVTEEEILTVIEEAEEDGTIRQEETKLIRSVIEFDDLEVGDILIPRVNIVAVDISESMENIREVFHKEGYSRIPVYKDSVDTIIGTIHQKDFFESYFNKSKNIDDILQNAYYTTEHVKISKLLKQLQKTKVHLAVVLDEYGGTLGIVTLEDILEELVGEIWDEHDEEITYHKQIAENLYTFAGNAPVDEFFEFFNMESEGEKYDASTVSGWVIEILGEIPRVGTKLTHLNLEIEVLKATIRRILSVKVTVKEQDNKEE